MKVIKASEVPLPPRIPKIIHQVWIGPKKMPRRLIDSWIALNPSWEHRLWTESELVGFGLKNQRQFDEIEEWAGKADVLRYELLHRFGGFFCDADSLCIKPLDDFLVERDSFAVFENEQVRAGLVANGYIGATKGNALMRQLIDGISIKEVSQAKTGKMAWQNVGPVYFTETISRTKHPISIYPSWLFIPEHYSGVVHNGPGEPYCKQFWGSTHELSDPEYYNKMQ
jgi:mannosyltransferase OCH1-like enzyme